MMNGHALWRWSGLVIVVVVLGVAINTMLRPTPQPDESIAVGSVLGNADNAGFERAYQPRPFHFPADHGVHADFRNEWWYVTGNIHDATGRAFGYQLTLFRIALSSQLPVVDSAWRSRQVYMGHFALTDVNQQQHYSFERFSRGALGLAGAQAVPFRVWLENWQLSGGQTGAFPMRVRAQQDHVQLDLVLNPVKPVVLQGDRGLSRKSAEPGNASYYYSFTRLATQGAIQIDGQPFTVEGASWLDREWSTSALGLKQAGWDWFALQLDDGREVMFYRLRRKGGGTDPHSQGVIVARDGQVQHLQWMDVKLTPSGDWVSPKTGNRYPAGWQLQIPGHKMQLTVRPKVADQEMRLTVRYWEGAVAVSGTANHQQIRGQGYLEMTRY